MIYFPTNWLQSTHSTHSFRILLQARPETQLNPTESSGLSSFSLHKPLALVGGLTGCHARHVVPRSKAPSLPPTLWLSPAALVLSIVVLSSWRRISKGCTYSRLAIWIRLTSYCNRLAFLARSVRGVFASLNSLRPTSLAVTSSAPLTRRSRTNECTFRSSVWSSIHILILQSSDSSVPMEPFTLFEKALAFSPSELRSGLRRSIAAKRLFFPSVSFLTLTFST